MHVLIMQPPEGYEVDHIDGNGLNNQRSNLRICTHAQNMANQVWRPKGKSGFRGITWLPLTHKWKAQITVNYKHMYLGVFELAKDAARAYDDAARKYFGKFASLNFPDRDKVV